MGLISLYLRRQWQPTPIVLPGKSHGWRSLVANSPRGREESDTTEQFHFHFSLSCTGEGDGNPLQCSRLENPRDGGAWWAAVYGVAQSRTRLTRLSCSSSLYHVLGLCHSFERCALSSCFLFHNGQNKIKITSYLSFQQTNELQGAVHIDLITTKS